MKLAVVGAGLVALLCASGCNCNGGAECLTRADCEGDDVCLDGRCVPPSLPDADGDGDSDTDADGDSEGDADGDADSDCPSSIVCGTPPVCCEPGEECIEGSCLEACESGVRCGASLATCCDGGQVCVSGECTDPGEPCTDSFDCPLGSFCEPTLDRCLPQLDPVTCEVRLEPEPFAVIEEWSWSESETLPEYVQPIAAPLVIDLDGDRVPEVVVATALYGNWQYAVLRALRGDSGDEVWTVDDPDLRLNGRASVAAADIDGDEHPEIVATGGDGAGSPAPIYAFEHDGTLKWASVDTTGDPSVYDGQSKGIAIADLDADGSPEIIAGGVVLDAEGRELWSRGSLQGDNNGYGGGQPTVANLDLEGAPEVVTGARAWRADGTVMWDSAPLPDGYPAVADFELLGIPYVVVVAAGTVRIHDGPTGTLYWGPVDIPGGGRGGPPTVADFDGDGFPEIGVAGGGSYSVYDPDGAADVLWSQTTQDESSNATGSSVFDFEGDGAAEVVYCDECFMRVYDGRTGDVLLEVSNSSATINEYPLVADVDGDGNSEIVVVANDHGHVTRTPPWDQCYERPGFEEARHGVFVYGDEHDRWVGTRTVWNQHAYHVTNVGADGAVPLVEADSWSTPGLNNFRQNVQGSGIFNAPDLVVTALSVDLEECPEGAVLQARIANVGSLGVEAGVPVAFYEGTPSSLGELIGVGHTDAPLLPGATTVVQQEVELEGLGPYSFVAVVDDDGTGVGIVVECDEDDNDAAIADVDCEILG